MGGRKWEGSLWDTSLGRVGWGNTSSKPTSSYTLPPAMLHSLRLHLWIFWVCESVRIQPVTEPFSMAHPLLITVWQNGSTRNFKYMVWYSAWPLMMTAMLAQSSVSLNVCFTLYNCWFQSTWAMAGVVAFTFSSSIWETEAEKTLSVRGQVGLYSESETSQGYIVRLYL